MFVRHVVSLSRRIEAYHDKLSMGLAEDHVKIARQTTQTWLQRMDGCR